MLSQSHLQFAACSLRGLPARWWHTTRRHTLDLLFNHECLSCGTRLPVADERLPLCAACLAEIPPVDWPVCQRCAAEVAQYHGNIATCPRCDADKLKFDGTLCLGHYEGLLRELILRMKTDRYEQWGQVFARLMADRYGEILRSVQPDAIVPIPMTPWNRWLRGTNGPAVIARSLSRALAIPAYCRLMQRTSASAPQRGLSRAGRFRNVRGGYRVRKGYHLSEAHILLIDDVMTTGATCSEVARLLKRKGAARVSVLVVARTPNN